MKNVVSSTKIIERGDIFFFYRPRVETGKVENRADVQRFFMLLAVGDRTATRFRLFVIGRKQLPEVRSGEAHPEERNWARNVLTTSDAERIRHELTAREYPTATRGVRHVGAAKAVGEGRYQLVARRGHTELAYALELPRQPGTAQAEFEIKDAASYIVAVKNPEIQVPGFPGADEAPRYPESLRAKFGDRRWIEVDDPALLDYEGTEILLIGAHAHDVEEELGIEIDEEAETAQSAEVFRTLRLGKGARRAPLFRGEFPVEELPVAGEPVERPPGARGRPGTSATRTPSRAPRARWHCALCDETFDQRSRYERHTLTAHPKPAPSAADVERALAGIDFPKTRRALVAHATRRLGRDSAVLRLVRALPDRRYRDAADVAIALGETKRPPRAAARPGRRRRRAA